MVWNSLIVASLPSLFELLRTQEESLFVKAGMTLGLFMVPYMVSQRNECVYNYLSVTAPLSGSRCTNAWSTTLGLSQRSTTLDKRGQDTSSIKRRSTCFSPDQGRKPRRSKRSKSRSSSQYCYTTQFTQTILNFLIFAQMKLNSGGRGERVSDSPTCGQPRRARGK